MWRTGTPHLERLAAAGDDGPAVPDRQGAGSGKDESESVPGAGTDRLFKTVMRLAIYGAATVGITVALLRPGSSGQWQGAALLARVRSVLGSEPTPPKQVAAVTIAPFHATMAPSSTTRQSTEPRETPPAETAPVAAAPLGPAAPQEQPAPTTPAPAPQTPPEPVVAEVAPAGPAAPVAPAVTAPAPETPVVQKPEAPAKVPVAKATKPRPTRKRPLGYGRLGPKYLDPMNGYSIQFPAGWRYRSSDDGGNWILDATDGSGGIISLGFSAFPPDITAERVNRDLITQALKGQRGTVVHGEGFATLAGRECVWHRYTGRVPRRDGSPRMTVVHYLLPLQDGRAMEVRAAAVPEKFRELAPRMKQSIESLSLVMAQARVKSTGPGRAQQKKAGGHSAARLLHS